MRATKPVIPADATPREAKALRKVRRLEKKLAKLQWAYNQVSAALAASQGEVDRFKRAFVQQRARGHRLEDEFRAATGREPQGGVY